LNGTLPSPGEYAFSLNVPPVTVTKYKTLIRAFMLKEEEVYKLTFRLFPLFYIGRVTKDPLLIGVFVGSLLQNGIISGDEEPITTLGRHAFNEYWEMALQPAFWPANHSFDMAHLRAHNDVVLQWQQDKKQQIDAFETQLNDFREKLEQ
jgi:hypothetical protein